MLEKLILSMKRHALPLSAIALFSIIVFFFHDVMKPFVIAMIVVYIMEPLVKRVNQKGIGKRKFPRWCAVILAYLAFFAAVVGVGFAFIPSLTQEISQATSALPAYFTQVKNEDIPRWSNNIDKLMFKLSLRDLSDVKEAVNNTSSIVQTAFSDTLTEQESNTLPRVDTSGSQPLLKPGTKRGPAKQPVKEVVTTPKEPEDALLKFVKSETDNTYYLVKGNANIILEPDSKGAYTVKFQEQSESSAAPSKFNLEREFNRIVVDGLEASTQYAGSALSFLQSAIQVIVNAFVQFILVFMLGAFISIDLPKFSATIRKIFAAPDGSTATFDDLSARLNKSLGGVIRGQMIICCINGTLTGIGLWIFDVDFALLLGIIAGVLSIIPIFGTIISTIPAVLLGLVQGFSTAVFVLIWILGVHFCDTNFFTPKIVGKSSSLHPVVIIFALLAGEYAFGTLGLILAIPIASVCQTLILFTVDHCRSNSSPQLATDGDISAISDNNTSDEEENNDSPSFISQGASKVLEKAEAKLSGVFQKVIAKAKSVASVEPVAPPTDTPSETPTADKKANSMSAEEPKSADAEPTPKMSDTPNPEDDSNNTTPSDDL